MMKKHLYTARIIVRNDAVKKDGTAAVALQVFINKKRKKIALGISVKPSQFDRKRQSIKRDTTKSAILHKALSRAQNIFCQAILKDTVLTTERFTELFQNEKLDWDFLSWMEHEIENLNSWAGQSTTTISICAATESSNQSQEITLNLPVKKIS